jgi:hypothetical protein
MFLADPLVRDNGSGSFYHQAKIVRKTLILTVLCLIYDFLSFKNVVKVPVPYLKNVIRKKNWFFFVKKIFCCCLEGHLRNSMIRIH